MTHVLPARVTAPELWRRFTITLRRVLARRVGLTPAAFGQRCRLSFVKVTEFQRRGVVHFHALIRLDAADDGYNPPPLSLTAADFADAIREAAASVSVTVSQPRTSELVTSPSQRQTVDDDEQTPHGEEAGVHAPGGAP
jgi:hypothetical protein